MSEKKDLIIIGGGPAGYVAAERAGAAGLSVLLAEERHLGGVCLNEGCIPSKTLLNSAKIYYYATHGSAYGVNAGDVTFDFETAMARKAKVIETLRKGVAGLMKRFKVTVIEGRAKLSADRRVVVGDDTYEADNILVATGSSPARPPIPGIELPNVVDSSGILSLDKLPASLVVVGGGVIGCELACFFGSLGIPVTVVEMLPEICPSVDADLAKILRSELGKKNITFHLGARVEEITEDGVRFACGDTTETIESDLVLMATGRTCNVAGLGLEDLRVDFDRRGIRIDDRCATNVPGVWAAGDVTGQTWLAHAASRMGEVVVHNITGRPDRMRCEAVPGVVYTNPEIACVGLTEAQAKERGIAIRTGKMPMSASGRYLAENAGGRGMIKVVVDAANDALLGVHMLGGACSESIFGAAAMIETEMRVKEIEEVVFPHPTVCELMRDTLVGMAH